MKEILEERKCEYPIIKGEKTKFGFFYTDFNTEERTEIIKNLVKKIGQYEQKREMTVKYYKGIQSDGKEIVIQAEVRSKDGIIKGMIYYLVPGLWTTKGMGGRDGQIKADFYFNSNQLKDKEEYFGLAKIIQNF